VIPWDVGFPLWGDEKALAFNTDSMVNAPWAIDGKAYVLWILQH
jgi:hypothetical protein